VEPGLQKLGQKEREVKEKLYARGVDEWWPESAATRWRITSQWGKMGCGRRKLRSSTSFIGGGGRERGERTAVPRVSDDTPAATRSGRDAAR
jgi:hypothetical protein